MYQDTGPQVRQLHSTNDHGAVYAVPDVRDVFVEYVYSSRRLYCANCDSSRCEHVDMVAAYRRQIAHTAHQMPVAARKVVVR